MRVVFLFLFGLILVSNMLSQDYYTDFSDGTLQAWTNQDSSTDLLTAESNGTSSGFNLQKVCDGSNSSTGEMTIVNHVNWVGNYFYGISGDEYMINLDYITLRNTNNFDLHIRYGFTGANGYQVVTTDPILVPALSDWDMYENQFAVTNVPGLYNLSIITDTGTLPYLEVMNNVHDLFEEVVEVRIFHNPVVSFDGELVTGNLDIDIIEALLLLSNEDLKITEVAIFPNPVTDFISIRTEGAAEGIITIYNVLGEKLIEEDFNSNQTQFAVSNLHSGVYMVNIKAKGSITTKKFVKL
ncbi:MAG: hypothetical protein ACI83B_001665 [Sediminicola sp.]|jgi:hypothetical protein